MPVEVSSNIVGGEKDEEGFEHAAFHREEDNPPWDFSSSEGFFLPAQGDDDDSLPPPPPPPLTLSVSPSPGRSSQPFSASSSALSSLTSDLSRLPRESLDAALKAIIR